MTATGHLDPLHIMLLAVALVAIATTPLHWR
jgi:hypothetical protein